MRPDGANASRRQRQRSGEAGPAAFAWNGARAAADPAPASWAAEPERSNALALRVMCWIALRCGRRIARGVL
jgi:hypothetical protein